MRIPPQHFCSVCQANGVSGGRCSDGLILPNIHLRNVRRIRPSSGGQRQETTEPVGIPDSWHWLFLRPASIPAVYLSSSVETRTLPQCSSRPNQRSRRLLRNTARSRPRELQSPSRCPTLSYQAGARCIGTGRSATRSSPRPSIQK